MKNITKTITKREVIARAYNHNTDELVNLPIVITGEKFTGLDKRYGQYEVLKVLKVGDATTNTYIMSQQEFTEKAFESESYMFGHINRKIGGEVAVCKAYNLDTDKIEEVEVTNDTEKRIARELEKDNYKLIKILQVKEVDAKYYYMSEEHFISVATIK